MKDDNYKMVFGYEVPKTISKNAKRCLRALRQKGVIVYENDDGQSVLVRQELINISGTIGLTCVKPNNYTLIILDPTAEKSFTIEGHLMN